MVTEKQQIKELEKQLKSQRLKNLILRLHMQVIVRTPYCASAARLRKRYTKEIFSDSAINLN